MPETTSKLRIPLPLGNETVLRTNHRAQLSAIEENAALDPFIIRSMSYDAANDRIVLTIGPGIAELYNGDARVLVQKDADTTYYINTPAINTTYYLYLQADGTFTHNTTGTMTVGTVLLWQVATGATVSTLAKTDRRAQLSGVGEKLAAHLADYVPHIPYAVVAGVANAYTVTLDPAPGAYTEGMAVAAKINTDNTGASTININNLGAKAIKKSNGNDVSAGNLKAGSIYSLRYNGVNFILQGEGGGGTADPADVLSGETFTNDQGEQIGTMPNRGAVGFTPSTVFQTIPAGYHNGAGFVVGDADLIAANIKSGANIFGVPGSVVEATGDALAGDVLTGKTFSKAGQAGIAGTMPNRGYVAITPSTVNQAIPAGYHSGSGVVYGDPNLIAASIKAGVNIFGVQGAAVEGAAISSIQTGLTTIGAQTDVTITPVDLSKSILVFLPNYDSSASTTGYDYTKVIPTAHFINNSTIRFTAFLGYGLNARWFVVSFTANISVQHITGTFTPDVASMDIAIAEVNLSKSFIIGGSRGTDTSATALSTMAVRGDLFSATILRLTRNHTSSLVPFYVFQVVTFTY